MTNPTQSSGRVNRLAVASTEATAKRVSLPAAAAAIVLAALLVTPLASAVSTARSLSTPHALIPLELETLRQINVVRADHGLRRLSLDQALSSAATAHSRQMLNDGYFSHETAGGVAFSRRIAQYYAAGSSAVYEAGENILFTTGTVDASGIVSRWMRSPGHRKNLLRPSWRQLGISVLTVGSAPGVYAGGPATVVTVDFGVRA